MPPRRFERAQASIELVGTLPLLLLGATACLQALLCGLSLVFAQSAADRAARGATSAQVRASLPPGWHERARVQLDGGRALVRIRPPALLPGSSRRLTVQASSPVVTR